MIDPDLYYLTWQQEHGELMRKTARRREVKETMRPVGKPGRSLSAQLISTYRDGLSLFAFLFLGSRRSASPAANQEARTTYQLNES